MIRALLFISLLLTLATAEAKIWIVAADGSGDFTEIQAAVDAAQDGDVIVVRDGLYSRILVTKGVTVVGTGPDRVIVQLPSGNDGKAAVAVTVEAGKRAVIAGLTAEGATTAKVYDSQGAHIWSRVEFRGRPWGAYPFNYQGVGISIRNSTPVFVNDCFTSLDSCCPEALGSAGIHASDATLAIANCSVECPTNNETYDGASAVSVSSSGALYLAESKGKGGVGGVGFLGGLYCDYRLPGGRGGAGASVHEGCTAVIAGRYHRLQGGAGGEGDTEPSCPGLQTEGGPGGDGIRVLGSGSALVSNVLAQGGPGGDGDPPGAPGVPYSGNVTFSPSPLPTSLMSGSSTIGGDLSVTFFGQAGDDVLLIVSDQVGILPVPATEGFPLMTLPGGLFLVRPLGAFDANGQMTLSFTLPNDPNLRGYAVFAQGIVRSPTNAHLPQITNLSLAVIAEP